MKEKHFFASANSGLGFEMRFDKINTNQGFTYIIKGGSGTGKSTLLKTIGQHFLNKGFDVEFVHCSTDPNSLDGVRIANKNLLLLDGTSPHVVDTKAPSALDKIVDVGQFVKADVEKQKDTILKILQQKSVFYKALYLILSGAEKLLQTETLFLQVDEQKAELDAQTIFHSLDLPVLRERKATSRNLFVSAIAENGKTNLLKQNNFKETKTIVGNFLQVSKTVEKLCEKVGNVGHDTLCFCDILNPKFFEGICIPSIGFCLMRENEKSQNLEVKFCETEIQNLLSQAGQMLAKAKDLHFELEEIYIKHTNFKEITKLTKKLIAEIEQKIK